MAHNPDIPQKRWTNEEAEELWHMRKVEKKTRAECAEYFKTSMSSLDMKYMALKSRMKRKGNLEGVNFWSEEDDNKLVASREIDRMSWEGVSHRFPDRTPTACRDRYQHLQEQKRMQVAGNRSRRRAEYIPQYTTITAFICKDPLPGRSALDRRVIEDNISIRSVRLNQTYSESEHAP